MSDPAPRRRFRFSLITLIVAVNVAGVLVWANVKKKETGAIPVSGGRAYETMRYGWPMVACVMTRVTGLAAVRGESLTEARAWEPAGVLTNAVAAILAVLFFGWATEFLVRRLRKAKHHDE